MLSRAFLERGTCGGCHGEGARRPPGQDVLPSQASLGLPPQRFSCHTVLPALARSPASHTAPLPPTSRLRLCSGRQPSLLFCSLHSSQLICDSGKGYYYHFLTC